MHRNTTSTHSTLPQVFSLLTRNQSILSMCAICLIAMITLDHVIRGLCPGVPVHKEITIVLSLFKCHWLAFVPYWLAYCIGSCETVHEDTTDSCKRPFTTKTLKNVNSCKLREGFHSLFLEILGGLQFGISCSTEKS